MGKIDVYIPRTADGELMTGPLPKHRLPKVRSIDVRTFFDPLADRNLPNAIPAPKAKPVPTFAPKGWRLRPVVASAERVAPVAVPVSPKGYVGLACPRCSRSDFRKSGKGFAWHVERCAAAA